MLAPFFCHSSRRSLVVFVWFGIAEHAVGTTAVVLNATAENTRTSVLHSISHVRSAAHHDHEISGRRLYVGIKTQLSRRTCLAAGRRCIDCTRMLSKRHALYIHCLAWCATANSSRATLRNPSHPRNLNWVKECSMFIVSYFEPVIEA